MNETATVTFEFDAWDTRRIYVNGIMVAWFRGYDPVWRYEGPLLMERLTREFSPGLLDEEIVE